MHRLFMRNGPGLIARRPVRVVKSENFRWASRRKLLVDKSGPMSPLVGCFASNPYLYNTFLFRTFRLMRLQRFKPLLQRIDIGASRILRLHFDLIREQPVNL